MFSSPRWGKKKAIKDNETLISSSRWQETSRDDLLPFSSSASLPPPPLNTWDVMLMILFVTATVVFTIFDKLVSEEIPSFPFAKGSLNTLNSVVIGYPLVLLVQYCYGSFMYPDNAGGVKWAIVVGTLFAIYNVLGDLGNRGNVVPGPIGVLVQKLMVPMSLLVDATPCLKRAHTRWHYYGSVILIGGVGFAIWAEWSNLNFSDNQSEIILDLGLMLISIVPASLAVAVAGSFLDSSPDTSNIYFWSWVVVTEMCVLPALAFLNAYVQPLPFDQIDNNLIDGASCLLGQGHDTSQSPIIDCFSAAIYFWVGFPCCIVYNLCIPALARKPQLGAPAVYLLRALAMPISVVFFTFPWVMGVYTSPFTWGVVLGMFLVLSALIVYYFEEFLVLYRRCRGRDERKLGFAHTQSSVSETTISVKSRT